MCSPQIDMGMDPLLSVSVAFGTYFLVLSDGTCASPFHCIVPLTLKVPVMVTSQSLPTKYLRAFCNENHHYPMIPCGHSVMNCQHYPTIPCGPCLSKSRFYLVYKLYIDCKYILYTYAEPSVIASGQKPCWGNYTL